MKKLLPPLLVAACIPVSPAQAIDTDSLLSAIGVKTAWWGDQSTQPQAEDYSLTLLHLNDHHSHLEPETGLDLDIGGAATRVEIGGYPRVVAKINELAAQHDNVLKIHAGDATTGTLYYSMFEGEADAALMGHVCYDVIEIGNHEFDNGDAGLAKFLDFLADTGCGTEVLAANVIPEVGTPLAPNHVNDYLKPYAIKTVGGQQIGMIGLEIAVKTRNSSSPLASTQFLDEAKTAQRYIDELSAMGIDKIVLVTHITYQGDLDLAARLSGVDVIIGGDSHTLLGDFAPYGLNPDGPYPARTTDKDGNPVCVAQAWQYSRVVGELNVNFDADGKVTSCGGSPHLLLGDTFKRWPSADAEERVELEGDDRTAVMSAIDADPQLAIVNPDPAAQAELDVFSDLVAELKNEVVGDISTVLCSERVPGQGESTLCNLAETAAHGGDAQQTVVSAFRARSFEADISLVNAGAVRVDVPAGPITIGDVYALLPFSNTLNNLTMTGAQVKQALEDALNFVLTPGGSTGAYPYASGLRWDVDLSQPFGQRFSNLEVKRRSSGEWETLNPEDSYTLVTISYLSGGRDGYTTLGEVAADPDKIVDTYIEYAQAFVDYVRIDAAGVLDKPSTDEYSTRNFYDANGQLQQ